MKHLIVYFLLLSGTLFSQETDRLTIMVYAQLDDGASKINCSLFKNHVFITSRNISEDESFTIDSLSPGQYSLQVKIDEVLYAEYYDIEVKTRYSNFYSYSIDINKNDTLISSTDIDTKAEILFDALYGNNSFLESQRKKNEIFKGEVSVNYFFLVSKYYSPGIHVGFSGGYTTFLGDTVKKFGQPVQHEYYLNGNIDLGFINRLSFFNNKLTHANGLKVDAGIIYNLPVIFRQFQSIDYHTRIKTGWIHRYNDFCALFRLSYKYIGLQAEYSLTTFLKNGYTEIPKYRAGLVFTIPAY